MRASLEAGPSPGQPNRIEPPPRRGTAAVRTILGALLAFAALNAFPGGYYGLAGAKGVFAQWRHDRILAAAAAVIVFGWLTLITGAFMMAAAFRRRLRVQPPIAPAGTP